jgi:flagellar protein FliS
MIALRRYTSTQNETASREKLFVLLLEAAMRHTRTAAQALEENRFADAALPIQKAVDIISELMATLDRSKAPELCDRLGELYTFINGRLMSASASKDPRAAREAERVLAPIADGFIQAVKIVTEGRPAAATP